MKLRYQPYYCEENVWWLLQDLELTHPHAMFVTNAARSVALWSQRAAPEPGAPVLWDYHVVALAEVDGHWHVFDLDCTTGSQLPLQTWVEASFPFAGAIPEDVEPQFRIVPAEVLFTRFRTDRSHMRDADGAWLAEPPPWAPLSNDSNLARFLDLTADIAGAVMDLDGLLTMTRSRHR